MKSWQYTSILFLILGCAEQETSTYERFYFRTDDADLAVEINGNIASKTFILLLHGGPGGGAQVYNSGTAMDLLEEQYAMVYLDQRGQGASKGRYADTFITLQAFSNDIYNLTRFIKAKYDTTAVVFLMGHSWGGQTGTHALLNTPVQDELEAWIEVDGAHDIPLLNREIISMLNDVGSDEITAGHNVEDWQKWIDYANALDPDHISISQGTKLNGFAFKAEELIDAVNDPGKFTYPYTLTRDPDLSLTIYLSNQATAAAIEKESEKTSLTDQLDQINIPTLLLWGRYDFVVPPTLGDTADILIPDSQLIIFENSGHSPMDNQPQDFAMAVTDFIEEIKADTTR